MRIVNLVHKNRSLDLQLKKYFSINIIAFSLLRERAWVRESKAKISTTAPSL